MESRIPGRFFSLRWKFFYVVAAVVLLMGLLIIVVVSGMNKALREEHDKKGAALAGHLATISAEPLLIDSVVALASLLSGAKEANREIVYAFVSDRKGGVVAHTFPGPFPPDLLGIAGSRRNAPGRSAGFLTERGLVADFAAPVMGGTAGTLHLGLSCESIEERIRENRNRLLLVTGIFLFVGLFLSHRLGTYLTLPLGELTRAAEEIGGGNLDRRCVVATRDEIGRLSGAFNRMGDDLRAYLLARREAEESLRRARDELDQRVKDRTAQLAAANRELEAFSYAVSHDLRAPLRGIDGFSLALLEDCSGSLDDKGKEYLFRIRNGCARMGRLIDDLLKLSRLTRRELQAEAIDLSGLALSVVNEIRESAPDRKVEVEIAPDLRVRGDPSLLRAAMANLLGNAWKFTRTRENPLIEFGRVRRDGRTCFFVRDNGVGFDMRYAQNLFGAFQRLHSGAEFEGSGIGLATVKRIIHRHGGMIWGEGEVGQGATFYFTLGEGPS